MSKRALILVEGQTEERFVKDTLGPAFWEVELFISPTILVTKRVKDGPNFKGGVTNFSKFRNDVQRLLNSAAGALVTTMLDYYRLPTDFPGMSSRPAGSPIARVQHVEQAVRAHFGAPPNFLPFLVLHEFEAWLYCDPNELPRAMTQPRNQPAFQAICQSVATPEDINERPQFAPSKRIEQLFPGYQKTLHGPTTVNRIGLSAIRQRCPHFASWLTQLETFASS